MAKFLEPVEKNTHIQHFSFIILFLFTFISGFAQPIFTPPQPNRIVKKYFVSKLGNDANNGLTAGTPWLTLDRVNKQRLFSGDTVVFRGGDTILGSLNLNSQKNSQFNNIDVSSVLPISFNSYGTGKATLKCADTLSYVVKISYLAKTKITFKNLNFLGIYNAASYSGGNSSIGYGIVIDNYTRNFYVDKNGVNIYPGSGGLFSIDSCRFSRFKTAGIGLIVISPLKQGATFNITSNDFDSIGFAGIYGVGIYSCNINITNNSITNIIGKNSTDNYSSAGIFFNRVNNAIIQYNYINKIGMNNLRSFGGIYIAGSSNCEVRRNEIKNVRNKTGTDGAGIYFNCQSDSNSAEYNYIANCETGIILSNATNISCPDWQTPEDEFVQSSYNVAAYNIIMMDSGATTGISLYNYPYRSVYTRYDAKFPKRNFIYNNLLYIKRSKDIGQSNMDDTAYFTCGIRQFGYNDSTYIYNNILYLKDSTQAISTALTHSSYISDSVTNQWGNLFTNSKILNNNYYFANGDSTYRFSEQLGTSGPAPNYYPLSRKFLYPKNWSDSTNLEKNFENLCSYFNVEPGLKNITQNLSAKINPYKLDTLTCFKIIDSTSNLVNVGLNFNSEIQKIATVLITDIYGNTIPLQPSIGIYQGAIRNRHYYVSAAGDDNNNGFSSTKSFKTITKLNSINITPGDTISFKGGDILYGYFNITDDISSKFSLYSDNVVFNSYGVGKATLRTVDSLTASVFNIKYNNSRIIKSVFKNLIFYGRYNPYNYYVRVNPLNDSGDVSLQNDYGILIDNAYSTAISSGTNIIIDSCEFSYFRKAGIGLLHNKLFATGNFQVTYNYVHHNGSDGIAGNYIQKSTARISNNIIEDIIGNNYIWSCNGINFIWIKGVNFDSNYVNRVGVITGTAVGGIYSGITKSSRMSHNEIRNIKNFTHIEGNGLYLDAGSDSNECTYNYISNCNGGIMLGNSTTIPEWNYDWGEDTLQASYSVAAYNVIMIDSGGLKGIEINSYNYGGTIMENHDIRWNPGKRFFIYNNLISLKNLPDPGQAYENDTIIPRVVAIDVSGAQDSTYIYNNIFVCGDSTYVLQHSPTVISEVSSSYYSNMFINSKFNNNITYYTNGDSSRRYAQLTGKWSMDPFFHYIYRRFSSPKNWSDSTGLGKSSGLYTNFNTNPLISNIYQNLSAKINPIYFDTLSCFRISNSSIAIRNGLNYNSQVVRVNDTLTIDWYGNQLTTTSNKTIGIEEKTLTLLMRLFNWFLH